MKTVLLTAMMATALFTIPGTSKATVTYATAEVCNACSPAMLQQIGQDDGNGDHYVYDFTFHHIVHFSTSNYNPRITSFGTVLSPAASGVTRVPIDAATQNVFNAVQDFYNVNGSRTYISVKMYATLAVTSSVRKVGMSLSPMTGTREMTAFDMVQTPVYRQMAIDTQTNFSHFDAYPNVVRAAAGTVLNMVNATPLVKVPLVMQITLQFTDGSTSVIQYDFNLGKFFYVAGSSKDAMGNPIPETPLDVSGPGSKTYIFTGTSQGGGGANAAMGQAVNAARMGISFPTRTYNTNWQVGCAAVEHQAPKCNVYPL